jgi:hypothetical protein
VFVAPVAGKGLVSSIAAERNGYTGARVLAEVPGRKRGRVGEGFAVVPHELRDDVGHVRVDDHLVVIGAVAFGDQPGVGKLALVLAREANRERLDRLGGLVRHQGDDQRRIEASRKERAEGNIGHHAHADGLFHDFAQLLGQCLDVATVARFTEAETIVGLGLVEHAGFADQPVPGGELLHAFECGHRRRHVLHGDERIDRVQVRPLVEAPRCGQRAELGREHELPCTRMIEEGLFAEAVPGQHETLTRPVPEPNGKHAAQVIHEIDSVLLVEMQDDLGV